MLVNIHTSNKKIEIRLSKLKEGLRIVIQDEGVGIEKADLDKLFQKFSRLENSLSVLVGGTGLGLYWVKKIIDLHEGTIVVKSVPGKGSKFIITL